MRLASKHTLAHFRYTKRRILHGLGIYRKRQSSSSSSSSSSNAQLPADKDAAKDAADNVDVSTVNVVTTIVSVPSSDNRSSSTSSSSDSDDSSTSDPLRPSASSAPDSDSETSSTSSSTSSSTDLDSTSSTSSSTSTGKPSTSMSSDDPANPTRTRSTRPLSMTHGPTRTKGFAGPSSTASVADDNSVGGPSKAGKIAGIVIGVVGACLLVMVISAYVRRWRNRKMLRDSETSALKAPPSEFGDSAPPTAVPSVRGSVDEGKSGPVWQNQPLVPPLPAAYQNSRSATPPVTFPQPAHASLRHNSRPHSLDDIPPAVSRNMAPTAIEMRGGDRTFSRPSSEMILNAGPGDDPTRASVYYDGQGLGGRKPMPARHNSYASTKYEALQETTEGRNYSYI